MAETNREFKAGEVYRLAWIFYLVFAVGGVVWLGAQRGTIALDLFFDAEGWFLDLAIGLATGGALLLLWELARRFFPSAQRLEVKIAAALGPLGRGEALSLAVLSGVGEELFFRGAMLEAWGFVAATLIFTVLHTGPGREFRLWTVFAAVAGVVFAGLVSWRGNLLAAIEAHALVNAIGLVRLARKSPDAAEQEAAGDRD